MRVLQVIGVMDRGGAETMVMNLYRAMDRERIQFDFLVHEQREGDYDAEIERLGGRAALHGAERGLLSAQRSCAFRRASGVACGAWAYRFVRARLPFGGEAGWGFRDCAQPRAELRTRSAGTRLQRRRASRAPRGRLFHGVFERGGTRPLRGRDCGRRALRYRAERHRHDALRVRRGCARAGEGRAGAFRPPCRVPYGPLDSREEPRVPVADVFPGETGAS